MLKMLKSEVAQVSQVATVRALKGSLAKWSKMGTDVRWLYTSALPPPRPARPAAQLSSEWGSGRTGLSSPSLSGGERGGRRGMKGTYCVYYYFVLTLPTVQCSVTGCSTVEWWRVVAVTVQCTGRWSLAGQVRHAVSLISCEPGGEWYSERRETPWGLNPDKYLTGSPSSPTWTPSRPPPRRGSCRAVAASVAARGGCRTTSPGTPALDVLRSVTTSASPPCWSTLGPGSSQLELLY